ncbi:MAG: hypothetical protein ACKV0T_28710 [Planctomycetales bacterium]
MRRLIQSVRPGRPLGNHVRIRVIGLVLCWLCVAAFARGEIRPDFVMDSDPEFKIPEPILEFPKRFKPLWIEALSRPEADMQRTAAETISQAHRAGVPELNEAVPVLVQLVTDPQTHTETRYAAARALLALEARDEAARLHAASRQYGPELRQLIEPALGVWNYEPLRDDWRARLAAKDPRPRELLMAIQGLARMEDAASVVALLEISRDFFRPPSIRLEASRAAGKLQTTGLEEHAQRYVTATSPIWHRLCAVGLLQRHTSDQARTLLLSLAQDVEPSVAAPALASLNAIDFDLVVPLAEAAMKHPDANVREQGLAAYVARPTPERMVPLARLLDDPHPRLRKAVREALYRLAQEAPLDPPVRTAAMDILSGDGWRGQEQASLLLGALEHKPAAARFVELLESTRPEVMVASAWGLRKVAVPETLPAALDKAKRQTAWRLENGPGLELDQQVGHLFELLGLLKYAAAEELFVRYIPKEVILGQYSRGAAIWALGHLREGVADEPLAVRLADRLTDPAPPPSEPEEFMRVRVAATLTIVRMGVSSQLPRMRKYMGPTPRPLQSHLAISWAVKQLTGEEIPPPQPNVTSRAGWFLEPLDDPSSTSP